MRHEILKPAAALNGHPIRDLIHSSASAVEAELDRAYGKGKWFLYWDEDMRGNPVRGTISLVFGEEILVVG